MPSQRLLTRGVVVLSAVLLLLAFACAQTASAIGCVWLDEAKHGETTLIHLERSWSKDACPSGVIRYTVKDANGNIATFPSMYSPELQFTPNPSAPVTGDVSYTWVLVDVLCNGIEPLCQNSPVYINVFPSTTTTTTEAPTEVPTEVPASSSSEATTVEPNTTETPTSSPVPEEPPVCGETNVTEVWVGSTEAFHPLDHVENCKAPAVVTISSQTSPNLFSVATDPVTKAPVVVFNAEDEGTVDGVYTAEITVRCSNGNVDASNECVLSQMVVAKHHVSSSPAPETPSCASGYSYQTTFGTHLHETLPLRESDVELCPIPADQPRHFVFTATSLPAANPASFVLTPEGQFMYVAPAGPAPFFDDFGVSIGCAYGAAPVNPEEQIFPLCVSPVTIRVRAAPPTPVPVPCTGDFAYTYALNEDGSFTPILSSLSARATVVESSWCPSQKYTAAKITSGPAAGTLANFDAVTGTFSYTPTASPVQPSAKADEFEFHLTCANEAASVCKGNATVSIAPAESDETIYSLNSDTIVCKGSCDATATTRQDGREVGSMEFDFTDSGTLVIRAFTVLSYLQAQFVTFSPVAGADVLLNSQAAPPGTHVSFEPTCLDKQAAYGAGSNIVSWSNTNDNVTAVSQMQDAHLNVLTENYHLGENYFQRFGGAHRHCDVYRANSCKYAPFFTPTLNDDNNNMDDNVTAPIQWRLFINGCDATWVGEASVESLRALRQADGSATFQLDTGSKLSGTLYMQTIAPVDINDPNKGYTTSNATARQLLVTLKNTILVDAQEGPRDMPVASPMYLASDIQFAAGNDRVTDERIYAYSILLYPSRLVDGSLVNVNTSDVKVKRMYLDYYSFTSPNRVECPECIGTKMTCEGTGHDYETDCGDDGIVSFGPINETNIEYDHAPESPGGDNLFPSTSLGNQTQFYNLSFAMRANGRGSADSADAFPVGNFTFVAIFANGQTFRLNVEQADYVSAINSKYLRSSMCRSSAYWPVADPFGSSVPIAPFDGMTLADLTVDAEGTVVAVSHEDDASEVAQYAAPEQLSTPEKCSLPAVDDTVSFVTLKSMAATIDKVAVSMCAVEEERTYGVTDWFMLSIPSIHEAAARIHETAKGEVIDDPTLDDDAFTTAELQYMILSINGTEAISPRSMPASETDQTLNILLDGTHPPLETISEEDMWMFPKAAPNTRVKYYSWADFGSFLNFRRIHYEHLERPADNSSILVDPFNFAFIPGALLHSSSSVRVPMHIFLSIKFTTYARTKGTGSAEGQTVVVSEHEDKLLYIISVSRAISSSMRFDSDVYVPKIVTLRTGGLGKTSATALLIIILVAVAITLAGSVYVEVTFKRKIHSAKYYPKRPDSAVGVRYGRDGQPLAPGAAMSVTSSHQPYSPSGTSSSPNAAAKDGGRAVRTEFGIVGAEQSRVEDFGDDTATKRKDTAAKTSEGKSGGEAKPAIGEEQSRVPDSEVASQI